MKQYISKDAIVAEIERRISNHNKELKLASDEDFVSSWASDEENQKLALTALIPFINTLEVKEIHEDIDVDLNPLFEEFGVEPDSRIASMFKDAFYKGVDRYLNKMEELG